MIYTSIRANRLALKPMGLSPEQIEQYRNTAQEALRIKPQRVTQTISYEIAI
jgi:hypothetical protein